MSTRAVSVEVSVSTGHPSCVTTGLNKLSSCKSTSERKQERKTRHKKLRFKYDQMLLASFPSLLHVSGTVYNLNKPL